MTSLNLPHPPAPEAITTPLKPYEHAPPPLPSGTDFSAHTGNLDGFPREPPSTPCHVITPLQSTPSYFLLTTTHLYLIPYSPTTLPSPSLTVPLSNIRRSGRRYYGVEDAGVEFFYTEKTGGGGWEGGKGGEESWRGYCTASVLVCFSSYALRESILTTIHSILGTGIVEDTDKGRLLTLYNAWLKDGISTFEYLMAVNSAAGRSVKDLSRYPVFPWTLTDYTSDKLDTEDESVYRDFGAPVGALNKTRLEYFKERREMMGAEGEGFLYGTHYSTSAYCLFYLVRVMPSEMMNLQSGVYDHPDRSFGSVKDCWDSVLSNQADLKELTPEFFDTVGAGRFLSNKRNIPLGVTQGGKRVNDVALPLWGGSVRKFVRVMRASLESKVAGEGIGRWIDLVFGWKSRGQGAVDSDNVFANSAYYNEDDVKGMEEDMRVRALLEVSEFGVCPDMIFVAPHGKKGEALKGEEGIPAEAVVAGESGRRSSGGKMRGGSWEVVEEVGEGGQEESAVVEAVAAVAAVAELAIDEPPTPASPPASLSPAPAPPTPPPARLDLQAEVALARTKAKTWLSTLGEKIGGGGKQEKEVATRAPVAAKSATPAAPAAPAAAPVSTHTIATPAHSSLFFSSTASLVRMTTVSITQLHGDAITGVVANSTSLVTVSRDCTVKCCGVEGGRVAVTGTSCLSMPACCVARGDDARDEIFVSGYEQERSERIPTRALFHAVCAGSFTHPHLQVRGGHSQLRRGGRARRPEGQ